MMAVAVEIVHTISDCEQKSNYTTVVVPQRAIIKCSGGENNNNNNRKYALLLGVAFAAAMTQ